MARFLQVLFPVRCIGCNDRQAILCASCLAKSRSAHPHAEPWISSAYDYRDPLIRKAIRHMKTHRDMELIDLFASTLADTLREDNAMGRLFFTKKITLIPIPIHTSRLRDRGFNQSALLAKALAKYFPNFRYLSGILIKPKQTKKQASVPTRASRLANLRGAFRVHRPEKIQGHEVIIVDDVSTTGATLIEARRVLHKAGAKKITALTLAH